MNMMMNLIDKDLEKKNLENNQNNQNIKEDNDEIWSIFFRRNERFEETKEFILRIDCRKNELVKDVIDRYLSKTNEKKEDLLFIFNSKKINENKTVQELGLLNNSRIFVCKINAVRGG